MKKQKKTKVYLLRKVALLGLMSAMLITGTGCQNNKGNIRIVEPEPIKSETTSKEDGSDVKTTNKKENKKSKERSSGEKESTEDLDSKTSNDSEELEKDKITKEEILQTEEDKIGKVVSRNKEGKITEYEIKEEFFEIMGGNLETHDTVLVAMKEQDKNIPERTATIENRVLKFDRDLYGIENMSDVLEIYFLEDREEHLGKWEDDDSVLTDKKNHGDIMSAYKVCEQGTMYQKVFTSDGEQIPFVEEFIGDSGENDVDNYLSKFIFPSEYKDKELVIKYKKYISSMTP